MFLLQLVLSGEGKGEGEAEVKAPTVAPMAIASSSSFRASLPRIRDGASDPTRTG
jgi:hypothetical protein